MQTSKTLAVFCLVLSPTYAFFGLGGHWAPNLGGGVDGSNAIILGSDDAAASLNQESVSGLQGGGVKILVDILPIIELEAAADLQFARYDAELRFTGVNETIPLRVNTGLPFFSTATPVFGRLVIDLTVKYPVFGFPPVVNIAKFYVGAGVSPVFSTAVLNTDFAKSALKNSNLDPTDVNDQDDIQERLVDALKDEGLQTGFGVHALVGAKVKPPVIPFAIYADGKYHLGGGMVDGAKNGLTLELGGALAF